MKTFLPVLIMVISHQLTLSALAFGASESWNGRIFAVKNQIQISFEQLVDQLAYKASATATNIVLGEKHYTPEVQTAQARVVESVVQKMGRHNNFTTAWEFLNLSDAVKIQTAFDRFIAGEIDGTALLHELTGRDLEAPYLPILEATKALGGQLLSTNLSHEEKAAVVRYGMTPENAALFPPGFEMGGSDYFERFEESMGGHGSPTQIQNYFTAQCLTDDVIAYHLLNDSQSPLRFLIVGGFHSDYLDGIVKRLKIRAPLQQIITIRLLDASDYSAEELTGAIPAVAKDPKYGDLADYVFFVKEPALKTRTLGDFSTR